MKQIIIWLAIMGAISAVVYNLQLPFILWILITLLITLVIGGVLHRGMVRRWVIGIGYLSSITGITASIVGHRIKATSMSVEVAVYGAVCLLFAVFVYGVKIPHMLQAINEAIDKTPGKNKPDHVRWLDGLVIGVLCAVQQLILFFIFFYT